MRAKTIDFQRGLSPKDSLKIGDKAVLLDKIENDEEWLDDWMLSTAEKHYGAFEMYLPLEEQKELAKQILINEKKLKVISVDIDDWAKDNIKDRDWLDADDIKKIFSRKKISPLLEKGWFVFNHEDNYDNHEWLLIR